jgi:hypothetical protein
MKRMLRVAGAVGFLALASVWWFSPTQVLKRRTLSLMSTLTMDRGAGKTSRQFATYSLNRLLAPEVKLENPTIHEANGTFERTELESAFSWLANQARETRFELKKVLSISVNGDVGSVEVALEGLVELPAYRPADGQYHASFDWVKMEDGWRLTRASWRDDPSAMLQK